MAHIAKYSAGACGHMLSHYDRSKQNIENIDRNKTHLNYNLAPGRDGTQLDFIHQRISEIKVQKRKDVNIFCDVVVTLPKAIDEEKSKWIEEPDGSYSLKTVYKEYSAEEERDFFKTVYNFLEGKFGANNVISAYVHKDETTPHMHFAFVPVVDDEKWNQKHPENPRQKLSAKECVTLGLLRSLHTEMQEVLDNKFGKEFFPVLNGATINGNLTVTELKLYAQIEDLCDKITYLQDEEFNATLELDNVNGKLRDTQKELKTIEQVIENKEKQQNALEGKIEALNTTVQKLEKHIDNLNEFGKKISSSDDWLEIAREIEKTKKLESKSIVLDNLVEKLPEIQPIVDRLMRQEHLDRIVRDVLKKDREKAKHQVREQNRFKKSFDRER